MTRQGLLFETAENIFCRVFSTLKPRASLPAIAVEFRRFANANSSIRLHGSTLTVRISDLFSDAPPDVLEALAEILIRKLYRLPGSLVSQHRYKDFLSHSEMRERMLHLRKELGWKLIDGPMGKTYDLTAIFNTINEKYFENSIVCPRLGWSRQISRSTLGHYDPSLHTIVISRLLDRPEVPGLAVEYVMFHEMLHLRYPVEHVGNRRCVHTREFKRAEQRFPGLAEAKQILRNL